MAAVECTCRVVILSCYTCTKIQKAVSISPNRCHYHKNYDISVECCPGRLMMFDMLVNDDPLLMPNGPFIIQWY